VNVIGYTILHYAVFILVGIIAAILVHTGERIPAVLAGSLILFVAIELGFYGFVALLGRPCWATSRVSDPRPAVLMGTYLWRAHPALRQRLVSALKGTSD